MRTAVVAFWNRLRNGPPRKVLFMAGLGIASFTGFLVTQITFFYENPLGIDAWPSGVWEVLVVLTYMVLGVGVALMIGSWFPDRDKTPRGWAQILIASGEYRISEGSDGFDSVALDHSDEDIGELPADGRSIVSSNGRLAGRVDAGELQLVSIDPTSGGPRRWKRTPLLSDAKDANLENARLIGLDQRGRHDACVVVAFRDDTRESLVSDLDRPWSEWRPLPVTGRAVQAVHLNGEVVLVDDNGRLVGRDLSSHMLPPALWGSTVRSMDCARVCGSDFVALIVDDVNGRSKTFVVRASDGAVEVLDKASPQARVVTIQRRSQSCTRESCTHVPTILVARGKRVTVHEASFGES